MTKPSLVNSRSQPCHPHVDSKLGGETSLASMSGRQPTFHRHSLSQPRAMLSPGPHAQTMPSRSATMPRARPVRHARPTPIDRAPPSPRAYMIATNPGDRQTSPFAAPCRTATARRRRRRLCRAEHRRVSTKPHRPTSRHRVVEHRQGAPHHPLPSPMPIAVCTVDHDELTLRFVGPLSPL